MGSVQRWLFARGRGGVPTKVELGANLIYGIKAGQQEAQKTIISVRESTPEIKCETRKSEKK